MTPLIPTRDALALLGITYRRLEHGVRQGVFPCTVPANGSGTVRMFSVADLLTIQQVIVRRQIAEELWHGRAKGRATSDA